MSSGKGMGVAMGAGIVGLIAFIGGCLLISDSDDDASEDEKPCAAGAPVVVNAPVLCVQPTDDTTGDTTADSVSEADPSATTVAGGASVHNTPDGQPATPPAESELAAGQQLFQGSSGDQIGAIAQDGAFRYLSLEHPGVVVGPEGLTSQAMIWPTTGRVVTFGVRTSASSNDGRYGFNLFVNGTDYQSGCTLEVGQISCEFDLLGELKAGDSVVFQIGEAGHLEETGDFTLDWWFIFEPAA